MAFNFNDGGPNAPAPATPAPESPGAARFRSCRWQQPAEGGNAEFCTHREVKPYAGTSSFDLPVNSSGPVHANNGTLRFGGGGTWSGMLNLGGGVLRFGGGVHNLSNVTIAGSGRAEIASSTVNTTGPVTVGSMVTLAHSATLGGNGALTVDGTFEWTLDVTRDDAPFLELVARYESDEPGHPSSASSPTTLRVDVPAATSAWALVALALCGVAIWLARSLWRLEVVVARPVRPPASPVELAKPRRGAERSTVLSGRLRFGDGGALTSEWDVYQGPKQTMTHRFFLARKP